MRRKKTRQPRVTTRRRATKPDRALTLGALRGLMALEERIGDQIDGLVIPSVLTQYREGRAQFMGAVKDCEETLRPFFESMSSAVDDALELTAELDRVLAESPFVVLVSKAAAGDRAAIVKWIRYVPLTALEHPEVRRQLDSCMESADAGDRSFLQAVVRSFRLGLLEPRRGQPPKGLNRRDVVEVVQALQGLYDALSFKPKRSYRNPAARRMDLREISDAVADAMPESIRAEVSRAVEEVLTAKPSTQRGFGIAVAAKVFRCSIPHIRSLIRRAQ